MPSCPTSPFQRRARGARFLPRPRARTAAILALLAGCATMPMRQPLDITGPGWTIREGQATWTPGHAGSPISGELTLASGPSNSFFVQFSKPPFTVVSGQASGGSWILEYPLQRKRFAGREAPPLDRAWFALPNTLGARRRPLPGWAFAKTPDGGWVLVNDRTGERLEGFLSP
jgi:hypothetical protein